MTASNGRFLMGTLRWRNVLASRLFRLLNARRFAKFGRRCNVLFPEGIEGAQNISIGSNVVIGSHSFLSARPLAEGGRAELVIADGARLGRFNHIYATHRILIGPRVLTANNVYIADNQHGYEDPDTPVFDQPLVQLSDVSIGAGTWICHGACVIGARVGRNCVIGAGALVRTPIPDTSVAVGSPARIVKRYDSAVGRWRRTGPDGTWHDGYD